jgi:hypothetical protein
MTENLSLSGVPTCNRCRLVMRTIADIKPIGSMSGMRIFQCEQCGLTDYFPEETTRPPVSL